MASWLEFSASAPELAERVRSRFDASDHKTLATLRADGAPRISGIETMIAGGEMWLAVSPGSRKEADMIRDSRIGLHSITTSDGMVDVGDAKLAGTADLDTDPEHARLYVQAKLDARGYESSLPFTLFRVDIREAAMTKVRMAGPGVVELVIDAWSPQHGMRTSTRQT